MTSPAATQAMQSLLTSVYNVLISRTCCLFIECVHDGHVGGPKQYNYFSLGNIFYFYANIFYCFSPPTWPPCTHPSYFVIVGKQMWLNVSASVQSSLLSKQLSV